MVVLSGIRYVIVELEHSSVMPISFHCTLMFSLH